MDASAMLCCGSTPKLPLTTSGSSSAVPLATLRLRKPSSSQWLYNIGSTRLISIGINPNKFAAHCSPNNDQVPPIFLKGAIDPLKSLLSIGPKKTANGQGKLEPLTSKSARIKNEALKMAISGKFDEAEKLMRGFYEEEKGKSEHEYNAALAFVEVLIHLEKYNEALKYLDDYLKVLKNDVKPLLYKAIVHTMLDQRDEAKKWWNKYIKIIDEGCIF